MFEKSHKKEHCELFAKDLLMKKKGSKNSKNCWGQSMDKSYLKKTFGCPDGHESTSKQGPPKVKSSNVEKLKKSLGRPKPSQQEPSVGTKEPHGINDEEGNCDEPSEAADPENFIKSGKFNSFMGIFRYIYLQIGTLRCPLCTFSL